MVMIKYKYLVQYNLGGLHDVYTLTEQEDDGGWWDKSGNFGGDKGDITTNGLVRRYFDSKTDAKKFHKELSLYRDFIKARM
jgi:hypothetical protein